MRLRLSRPTSIRSRLLLSLVCIIAVTAAALSGVTAVLQSRDARHRVVGQLKSVATLKEQEIESWISGLDLNLDIVLSGEDIPADLHTLTVAAPDAAAYRSAYERVLQRLTWASVRMGLFEELFFMGPEGEVLASTDKGHERQRLGISDFFIQGMQTRFIQQPSYSLSLKKMTVVASCPVLDHGSPVGVLAGRANLDSLNSVMLGRAGLGETGETYLVGSNHRLLTALRRPGYPLPDTYIRTTGSDTAVDERERGSATYQGYAHETVIGVYAWIPRLKVALLAEQGEAEALRATRLALWTTGGLAVFAAALAILAGIALTRSIVRPLSELDATASRIAAGELDLSAPVARRDEIGRLAQSFNRMTGQLRDLVRGLERRTDRLRAINLAGRQISSILELDQLLPSVAKLLLESFDYDRVRIFLFDEGEHGRLLTCERRGCEQSRRVTLVELDRRDPIAVVAKTGEPLPRAIPRPEADDEQRAITEIAVDIRVGVRLAGVLALSSRGRALDEQDLFTARTHADQLAIAIENSRLYRHARELAADKERQRLARDLHDAVSQTLFSVSLIAEVLPRIYERDAEQGKQRLEELRQLTRGALAEMRTLLLELRPAALAETELPDLLRQLGEAVTGRSRIPVEVVIEGEGEVPSEVSVAFYRIAQEALNNIAKHSGAQQASVTLKQRDDGRGETLVLIVEDDGRGFDADETASGRLGLGIVAERAAAIGAELKVDSRLGEGARVSVVWRA